jgi:hypothetical protein
MRGFANIFGVYINIAVINTFSMRVFANIFGIHNDLPMPTLRHDGLCQHLR